MKQNLYNVSVCLSPLFLKHQDISGSVVVIIDILRATSTIVTMLKNRAKFVIPVEEIQECIHLGKKLSALTVGERNGQVVNGLEFPNSPFLFSKMDLDGKVIVLTTNNGTRLLHKARQMGANNIVIGSFLNIDALCHYLIKQESNIVLACSGWNDQINIEDTLFAGAVAKRIRLYFNINYCDSLIVAESLFKEFIKHPKEIISQSAHYRRLKDMGYEEDINFCFEENLCDFVPIWDGEKLVI